MGKGGLCALLALLPYLSLYLGKKEACEKMTPHFFTGSSYPERCAILLGNEGNGLSDTVTALSDERVFIPMEGKTESLNVAVAGALLLYEARRKHASAVSR